MKANEGGPGLCDIGPPSRRKKVSDEPELAKLG
jgi:hypothetical protein